MAIYLSRQAGLEVRLWCFLEAEAKAIRETGFAPNLPQFSTQGKVVPFTDPVQALAVVDLVVISTPVPFLRNLLQTLPPLPPGCVVLSINKGIEREQLQTVPEILAEYLPQHPLAHLGGPCFPEGLLSEVSPAAETLACTDLELGRALQHLFAGPGFRVYLSNQLRGVALLGALKNIYAILAGIGDGQGMTEEALAVLITRALAEMRRFCEKLEIPLETLYGLSGLGDLVLTCYSPGSSHNKNLGRRLGQGETIENILGSMSGQIAEGYYTTKAAWELAQKLGLEMPMCKAAYGLLYEGHSIQEALGALMDRPLKQED